MATLSAYERLKAWRKANPEKVVEQARRYRERYPDRNAAARRRYRVAHLEDVLEADRLAQDRKRKSDPEGQKRRYEEWRARKEAKLTRLAGGRARPEVCDLCFEAGPTVFDHCHEGGHFRGWLCDRCNRTLGQVKDDAALLRKMADYLEEARGEVDSQAA